MNRNSQNHFRNIPNIDIQRSKFHRPHTHKTTFNAGDLIPFYVDEILPGDTVQMDMGAAIRMRTPIFAVMDNAYVDTYFFYTPFRLVWEHYQEFMGENKLTAWEQPVEYEVPQIQPPEGGWEAGTIADYMGIPTKVEGFTASALYFRRYAKIWNEWFRDQNVKDAAMVNLDETTQTGANDGDYVSTAQLGAKPLKAARYHSYFTSALPEPQKGPDVLLPLGNINGEIPVVGNGMTIGLVGQTSTGGTTYAGLYGSSDGNLSSRRDRYGMTAPGTEATEETGSGLANNIGLTTDVTKSGMIALVNNIQNGATTINQLRQAFAVQRLYERDARGGTR